MSHSQHRIITLTTDFGTSDAYAAAMKGVILGITPDVTLIDISHAISPQDIMEGAFVLKSAAPYFPDGSVHLAVIDPSVGSARQPIALRKGEHWYVGPDNGLFSLILDGARPDEVVVLDKPEFWLSDTPGHTFHGRDIFAPVAAHLAAGTPLSHIGTPVDAIKPLYWALPIADQQGVQGWVMHVDRFGNCITNISRSQLPEGCRTKAIKCYVGSTILDAIQLNYAGTPTGEPLMLFGSSDMLEIAVNAGNASELLSIRKGSPVNIVFMDEKYVEPE